MKSLFTFLLVLVLIFSCAVSSYLAFFKFPLKDKTAKVLAFLAVGAALTAVVFILCFAFIWPPVIVVN